MSVKISEYCECFASCGMLKVYARRVWKRCTDTGEDLMDLPTMDEQDALMAEDKEAAVPELVVTALPAVDVDAPLAEDEDGDGQLEGAVGLDKIECAGVNRKPYEL